MSTLNSSVLKQEVINFGKSEKVHLRKKVFKEKIVLLIVEYCKYNII